MFAYRHSGLTVSSDIELPEWEAFAAEPVEEPDVRIAISYLTCPDGWTGATGGSADCAHFAVEGVGGWRIEKGRQITLFPAPSADARELRLFTLGSAWGLLGYQRGDAMWHGSAVSVGERTVMFCGDAGEGKSTMAAAMLDAGATLVADDLSRVDPGEGGPLIHPSSSRLKLWGEAVDHFGWRERVLHRDFMREDKFHCAVARHHAGGDALPLSLVVVLQTGKDHRLKPLRGGEAVQAVLKGTIYRPEALEALGRWQEQAIAASRIVAGCSVARLTRPRDLAALDRSTRLIIEFLGSLG